MRVLTNPTHVSVTFASNTKCGTNMVRGVDNFLNVTRILCCESLSRVFARMAVL